MNKCKSVTTLDCGFNFRVKYALNIAIKNGYLAMKLVDNLSLSNI